MTITQSVSAGIILSSVYLPFTCLSVTCELKYIPFFSRNPSTVCVTLSPGSTASVRDNTQNLSITFLRQDRHERLLRSQIYQVPHFQRLLLSDKAEIQYFLQVLLQGIIQTLYLKSKIYGHCHHTAYDIFLYCCVLTTPFLLHFFSTSGTV